MKIDKSKISVIYTNAKELNRDKFHLKDTIITDQITERKVSYLTLCDNGTEGTILCTEGLVSCSFDDSFSEDTTSFTIRAIVNEETGESIRIKFYANSLDRFNNNLKTTGWFRTNTCRTYTTANPEASHRSRFQSYLSHEIIKIYAPEDIRINVIYSETDLYLYRVIVTDNKSNKKITYLFLGMDEYEAHAALVECGALTYGYDENTHEHFLNAVSDDSKTEISIHCKQEVEDEAEFLDYLAINEILIFEEKMILHALSNEK
jgi:hypothetical protein